MPKEDPFVNRAQLLKAIKKYPEIWDSNNKLHMCRSVTAPMWNEIAEQFGGHVPTVKLQSIWSQMKYHYHNLVHRQILHKDRFTTKWEHFEPMSFMYNITVAKIVGAASSTPASSTTATSIEGNQAAAQLQMQQLETMTPQLLTSSLPQQPSPATASQSHGRGRPSGSFTWLPPIQQPQSQLPNHTEVSIETTPYTAFTGLVPPAAITVEATTTPMRKPGRPGSLNNSMRGRIIEAIKARHILWAGRQLQQQQQPREQQGQQRQGQNRTSAIWKEVAHELGLTPSLVQTRWSIIKQRYVDELQKERHAQYSQQSFHSTWEHFERMSFMREILTKKVDEREQTREHIQEIVSEQQQLLHTSQQQQQQQQQQQLQHQEQHQHMRYMRAVAGSIGTGMGLMPTTIVHEEAANGSPSGILMSRRRVKTETDLEWDPFEMILHVHGTEPASN